MYENWTLKCPYCGGRHWVDVYYDNEVEDLHTVKSIFNGWIKDGCCPNCRKYLSNEYSDEGFDF